MKKKLFIILSLIVPLVSMSVQAQPSAAKQKLLKLKTYKTGGELLSSSYACIIDKDGTTLSAWTPFVGADSAVVTDASGRSYRVAKIIGANELYNIARFEVSGVPATLQITLAKSAPSASSPLWVMTDSPVKTTLLRTEKFMEKYNFYVLNTNSTLNADKTAYPDGSPVVTDKGELVGMYNNGVSVLSATDYNYGRELQPNAFSGKDPTLSQTSIRKALPSDYKSAQVALMMLADGRKSDFMDAARDFIKMFPKQNDGYSSLANSYLSDGNVAEADKLLQQAIANATDKGEAHYNYSRAIWQKVAMQPEPPYGDWTFDKAMTEADAAYKIDPQPAYDEMKAKIDYGKGNYQAAYDKFISLTKTSLRNPELYLEAAQSKEHLNAPDAEILSLLDSAVAVCDTPYTSIAAPFFYARGNQYAKMGRYRDATFDLYRYELLSNSIQSVDFYYNREQMEMKTRLYKYAIDDINRALLLDTKNAMLWCEKANVHMRVNQLDDALRSADEALKLDDSASAAYIIKGIVQCEKGNKTDGLANLEKAKTLGDTQADTFIKKYK